MLTKVVGSQQSPHAMAEWLCCNSATRQVTIFLLVLNSRKEIPSNQPLGSSSLQSAKKGGMKMRTAPLQVPRSTGPADEAEGEGFQSRYEFGVSRWPGLLI